jgi:hypothetical protein
MRRCSFPPFTKLCTLLKAEINGSLAALLHIKGPLRNEGI